MRIGDSMLFNGAAAILKNGNRPGGSGNVFGFLDHSSPVTASLTWPAAQLNSSSESAACAAPSRKKADAKMHPLCVRVG
jgi:hypothetical protein